MSRSKHYTSFDSGLVIQLNEELDDIYRKLDAIDARKTVIITANIGTTETEVRHNLKRKPEDIHVIPKASAYVYQTRTANETSVYLAANAAVAIDLYLK